MGNLWAFGETFWFGECKKLLAVYMGDFQHSETDGFM
jgi:hypothetical protein